MITSTVLYQPLTARLSLISYHGADCALLGANTLTPPRSNGKVVGDRGATGRNVLKGVKASASDSYLVLMTRLNNLRSGGAAPCITPLSNCLAGKFKEEYVGVGWKNITRTRGDWPKRYSFASSIIVGPLPQADIRAFILSYTHQSSGTHMVVSHPKNGHALCGKVKKRPL
ncbi:unnamed protein product [Closterium sp. Naga37s-1]|nr:unnamed protein product [Closterium sp. Naga37s-1]